MNTRKMHNRIIIVAFTLAIVLFGVIPVVADDVADTLRDIQREGNAWIKPSKDISRPYMVLAKGDTGSCSNFAAIKKQMIRERLPNVPVFYWEGYFRRGKDARDYHAVVVVPHKGKWYVLDNLSTDVMVTKPGDTYLVDEGVAAYAISMGAK